MERARTRIVALALVGGLVITPTWARAQASLTDTDLATGIRQVREGDFDIALITLDGVVKRLAGQKGQEKELARAYTYLAIAYVGLAQQEKAKAEFMEAWRADRTLSLSPKEFPPNIIEFFEQARKEAAAGEAPPVVAPATAAAPKVTPPAAAPAGTSTASGKKGGSKLPLVILGVAGAGAAVAAAAASGGGNGAASNTVQTTLATPTTTTPPRTTTVISGQVDVLSANPEGNDQVTYRSQAIDIGAGPIDASVQIAGIGAGYTFDFCPGAARTITLSGGLGAGHNPRFPGCVFAGSGAGGSSNGIIEVHGTASERTSITFFLWYNDDGPTPSRTRTATFSGTCTHP